MSSSLPNAAAYLPDSLIAASKSGIWTIGAAPEDALSEPAGMEAAPAQSATGLNPCALVVDDEMLIADLWSMVLAEMGVPVCGIAATALSAIDLAQRYRPKVVLMDMRLRGHLDGVDAALVIHEKLGSNVIFITGSKDITMKQRIEQDHPFDVLFKPVSERQLKTSVTRAMVS